MGTTYGFCSSLAESITNIHITTCELESQWELAARRREPKAGALDTAVNEPLHKRVIIFCQALYQIGHSLDQHLSAG